MKKFLLSITIIALLMVSIIPFSFADDSQNVPQWFKDMITWKKEQINEAVKEGTLNEEQAKSWIEHFDYMEKWHEENGFNFNGAGPCHGGFRNNRGFRSGFGPGMMYRNGF